jgi:hypothetical protein
MGWAHALMLGGAIFFLACFLVAWACVRMGAIDDARYIPKPPDPRTKRNTAEAPGRVVYTWETNRD